MFQVLPNYRLKRFYNIHAGETVILVANGPSLNKMNLDFLKHYTVIGMNKIFLGFRRFNFYPKYYVAVNDLVIHQVSSEINQLNCVRFVSARNKLLVPESALTYHINTCNPLVKFYTDITHGINEGSTVTFAALQIAYYMGFKRVVIIGLDHRFSYQGGPNQINYLSGDDSNHFEPSYFANQLWQNPDLERSEFYYAIANRIFSEDGREIIDATVDGACQIFKKQNYLDFL